MPLWGTILLGIASIASIIGIVVWHFWKKENEKAALHAHEDGQKHTRGDKTKGQGKGQQSDAPDPKGSPPSQKPKDGEAPKMDPKQVEEMMKKAMEGMKGDPATKEEAQDREKKKTSLPDEYIKNLYEVQRRPINEHVVNKPMAQAAAG